MSRFGASYTFANEIISSRKEYGLSGSTGDLERKIERLYKKKGVLDNSPKWKRLEKNIEELDEKLNDENNQLEIIA